MQNSRFFQTVWILLSMASALSLTACGGIASKVADCQELDWYEIGRRDGSLGITGEDKKVVKTVCENADPALNIALYTNGYDSGIAQYCSYDNGFEFGRVGKKPAMTTCPPLLRDIFETGLNEGQKLADMQKRQIDISNRIENINGFLTDRGIQLSRRGLLKGEKLQLEQKQKNLEAQINILQNRISRN